MADNVSTYRGPAILAGGYRAFFFGAALWALVSVVLWVLYLSGVAGLENDIDMILWHGHTLVFGYGGAVVAGFALTAIPNWTGRQPVRGWLLAALVVPWLVARGAELGLLAGRDLENIRAAAELLFFLLFVVIAAREVIAGKNWRNLKIIGFFAIFLVAAGVANLDRLSLIDLPFAGWVTGLALLLTLICVIGGRIIPAFTGNWMRQQKMSPLPVAFNLFDGITILVTIAALVAFIGDWSTTLVGAAAAIAGVLHCIRLARWQGWQTVRSPIVAVLHVSYLWVPVGFLLVALTAFGTSDIGVTSALHAWTIGGIGSTTLAVMTRASLGHAGLPLQDSPLLTSVYAAINLAAFSRLGAVYAGEAYQAFINAAGILWCVAFILFLVGFGPIHWRKKGL